VFQTGIRGRQIATLTIIVAAVALATSAVSVVLLAQTQVAAARDNAELLAQGLFYQARRVIRQVPPEELPNAFATDRGLHSYAEAVIGYSPTVLYVAIADANDVVIFHSDPLKEGMQADDAEALIEIADRNALLQLWKLGQASGPLVVDKPFSVEGDRPFGTVYVAISGLLLKKQLYKTATINALVAAGVVLLAFGVATYLANRMLAPLDVLRERLASIDVGENQPPLDLRTEEDISRVAEFFDSLGQRLESEQRLDESGLSLNTLLAGMNDAVLVLAADRTILSLNAAAGQLLGAETRPGRRIDELLATDHPVQVLVDEALTHGRPDTIRTVALTVDEQTVEYLLTAHLLREPTRRSGVLVTARNMQQLSQLASQLSYAQKISSLGRLTSGVAHELRNPLNAMTMHLTILRKKIANGSAEAERHVDVLEEELRRLHRVVKGFLEFSRPDEIELQPVDIKEILGDAVKRVRPLAETNEVEIEIEPQPDLPPIIANFHLLEQAFVNVLTNSCEASPDGGRIHITTGRGADGGIAATVQDSGSGIPPESLAKVFDLYYTTKPEGSGVGLALVYRIAQLHGGDVDVQSEPGAGTRVTISLPGGSV
jgi:signal transduction histidine kinase